MAAVKDFLKASSLFPFKSSIFKITKSRMQQFDANPQAKPPPGMLNKLNGQISEEGLT